MSSARNLSPASAASPHGDEKARQILDGARRVFLSMGFDGASVNDIARAAGVSKGTIYFHFDSKEALFEALIREEREQQAEQLCGFNEDDPDVATVLFDFGRSLLTLMMRPDVIEQVRTVMAVARKFPRLGRAFYDSGPQHGVRRIAAYMVRQTQAGRLRTPDADLAAAHFIQLCQGDIYKQMLFCAIDQVSDKDIEYVVRAAVNVFMKAYGPG